MRLTLPNLAILVASLAVPGASSAVAQNANDRIAAEISRLEQSLKTNPITDPDFAPVASSASENLAEAFAALSSGKLYLSLEKLLLAEDLVGGARFPAENLATAGAGYAAFEAQWKTVSRTVSRRNRESLERDSSRSPAVVRALTETAVARCLPLLDGGRGFAASTKPADGLLYVGQAQGESAFAGFASSLVLDRSGAPFPLRSFLPELQALQRKTNQAFKPPRSVQLHQRFIALNSALKLAQELDAQKSYAGALYQYLEATRHFAMLDAPQLEPGRRKRLKEEISITKQRLSSAASDNSIAALFLERAASQIDHPDGSAPSPDEWRSAQVILETVVPAYLAAQTPAAALPPSGAKTVQLTLVRWPYT